VIWTATPVPLRALGVTPGVYVWTWEPPATATDHSFAFDALAATVPEPASLALLALPLGLVMRLCSRGSRQTGKRDS
jgi:hypothetical protein